MVFETAQQKIEKLAAEGKKYRSQEKDLKIQLENKKHTLPSILAEIENAEKSFDAKLENALRDEGARIKKEIADLQTQIQQAAEKADAAEAEKQNLISAEDRKAHPLEFAERDKKRKQLEEEKSKLHKLNYESGVAKLKEDKFVSDGPKDRFHQFEYDQGYKELRKDSNEKQRAFEAQAKLVEKLSLELDRTETALRQL